MELPRGHPDRLLIGMSQDEACCNSNETAKTKWRDDEIEEDRLPPKSKDQGLMMSVFISEVGGAELEFEGEQLYSLLEYGDGEWRTSPKMIYQLKRVMYALQRKHPWADLIFHFDHASNHKAMYADALNARSMNMSDGG